MAGCHGAEVKTGFSKKMARPERFELPTNWFEASYSIQLSYGRVEGGLYRILGPAVLRLQQAK
jgi:hypothetical protein